MHLPHDLHCGTYIEAMRTVEALMPQAPTHRHRYLFIEKTAYTTHRGDIQWLYKFMCRDRFCPTPFHMISPEDFWDNKIFSPELPD